MQTKATGKKQELAGETAT